MNICSYCGRKSDGAVTACPGCGGAGFVSQTIQPPKPRGKFALWVCRIISFVIGTLLFLLVAPEFRGMPGLWIMFWTIFPLAPILCVWIGAGRNLFLEVVGWLLHVAAILVFL